MTTLLVSPTFAERHRARLDSVAPGLDLIVLPSDPEQRLPEADIERIELAHFSTDVFPDLSRSFFAATQGAAKLRWMHCFHAGVDAPVFQRLLARGVRLTTSSGSTAKPIAQSAIGGMLMLSRGFDRWGESQRRHTWEPHRGNDIPADLQGETMVVVGLGAIGSEIARLAQAIGLYVIGVRRSLLRPGDPVDEMRPPWALKELLPRTDWLALACPLTEETRHLIGVEELALLPRGARVINIARGEVIDESALIEALASKQLAGAYLDVFATEPLPEDSPLWDMPGVIVTPHNSAAAAGNEARTTDYFFENLDRWLKSEEMVNEVKA